MADAKITELTALTALADADLFAVVDDVAGTATTKKITAEDARAYLGGVIPAGSTLAEVQAAVDALPAGGGTIELAPGAYSWNGTLNLVPNLRVVGYGATITQSATTGALIAGEDVAFVTLEGMKLEGPGGTTGTGTGITITRDAEANTPYIVLRDMRVAEFGGDGIQLDLPIVSRFERVIVFDVGGHGFNVNTSGSYGTSVHFASCYALTCRKAGYFLDHMAYSSFDACASDTCGVSYWLDQCFGITFNGCGFELPQDNETIIGSGYTGYVGIGWRLAAVRGVHLNACYGATIGDDSDNVGDFGIDVLADEWASTDVVITAFKEGDPNGGTPTILRVASTCEVTLNGFDVVSTVTNNGTIHTLRNVVSTTGTPATVENSTTEAALYTYTIPAGLLASGDLVRFTAAVSVLVNDGGGAASFTFRVRLGGVSGTTLAAVTRGGIPDQAGRGDVRFDVAVGVQGSAAQYTQMTAWFSNSGSSTAANSSSTQRSGAGTTVDTSTAQDLVLTVTLPRADANVEARLEHAAVELVRA